MLAKVGERTITLGDYAAVLERMDRFERMRYQTDDRRKQLLDEIIDVELLAAEAERRGLDKTPEARQLARQVMRDEMLRELRAKMPAIADIPVQDVRAYYDAHRDDFREPERRRVAHIVVGDEALAKKLVAQARAGDPKKWGELVEKHSLERPKRAGAQPPPELAGDLGMVALAGSGSKENQKVPQGVRDAVFKIEKIAEVFDQPVRDENRWHIVRMTGKSAARDRSFAEAERTIRVRILQEKTRKAEADLEQELRKKYPVTVNQAALDQVKVPSPDDKPTPGNKPSAGNKP